MVRLEQNGFACLCGAMEESSGKWTPIVVVERIGPRRRRHGTAVIAVRYTVDRTFPSEAEAEKSACDFALAQASRPNDGSLQACA